MTKLNDLKEILKTIPEGKRINTTAITAVADLDFFRKEKPNTVTDKEKVKISFDRVFMSIYSEEKELNPTTLSSEFSGLFSGFSDKLYLSLVNEIGNSKVRNIAKITLGFVEEDTSFLDEPSTYEKFFVFDIVYKPKKKFVKQTDKEVVDSLKSQLGQLRKEIQ